MVGGLACGPVLGEPADAGSDDAEGGGDDSSGSVSTTVGPSTTTVGPTDDSGDEGSGNDTADPLPAIMCIDGDGATPVAVINGDAGAWVLRADASQLPLDVTIPVPSDEVNVYTAFDARGDYVAMTRTTTHVADGIHYDGEVGLFTATGASLWQHVEAGVSVTSQQVGHDGSMVAARDLENFTVEGVLYSPAGVGQSLPDLRPAAPQRDDGLVPGYADSDGGTAPVWLDPDTLAFHGISFTAINGWHMVDDGDFVYLAEIEGVATLVREGPDGAELSTLPDLGGTADVQWITPSSDRAWLLVHLGEANTWFRVAVADGVAEPVDLTPPIGLTMFECYSPQVAIDDAGRFLLPVRDASAASVMRFDPSSGAWETIGEAVTAVDDVAVWAYGETYFVRTSAQGTTFCPTQVFEPGPATLSGYTQQIVRPIDGFAMVLTTEDAWPVSRNDGRCIGLVGARGTTMIDLQDDVQLELPGVREVWWWEE